MKTPEDGAFDELATRQGDWGSGFQTKPWNEDEWRRNNWRCGHGWLRGEQCEICNAPQPVQEPVSEALKLAEIIEHFDSNDESLPLELLKEIAATLRALAQPVQEPPSEWAGIKAILGEYGLQAIDFVADFKAFLAQPAQEPTQLAHIAQFMKELRPAIGPMATMGKSKTTQEWFDIVINEIERLQAAQEKNT